MLNRVVVKITGHLIKDRNALRNLLNIIVDLAKNNVEIAIIPGGSIFADFIRDSQNIYGFSDSEAHWLAIKAMEMYGIVIKHTHGYLDEAHSIDDVYNLWRKGSIPIVFPYTILKSYSIELPESWAVTSDSISIAIAHILNAKMAILTKVIDGIYIGRELVRRIRVEELVNMKQDVVDQYVPMAVKRYRVPITIVNAYKPWLLKHIVHGLDVDGCTIVEP